MQESMDDQELLKFNAIFQDEKVIANERIVCNHLLR